MHAGLAAKPSSPWCCAICPPGPAANRDQLEKYEGMLVRFSIPLTVTEVFQLARFGEATFLAAGRVITGTQVPGPLSCP